MKRATDSISSGEVSKSGKPCERLIAPTSLDRRVMTAKMLTPPEGSFDGTARAWDIVSMIAPTSIRSRHTEGTRFAHVPNRRDRREAERRRGCPRGRAVRGMDRGKADRKRHMLLGR